MSWKALLLLLLLLKVAVGVCYVCMCVISDCSDGSTLSFSHHEALG